MGHSGVNNDFLVASGSPIVDRFGEKSVLENYSYEIFTEVFHQPDNNFVDSMAEEDRSYLLEMVRTTILATDMAQHEEVLKAFCKKNKGSNGNVDNADPQMRELLMKMFIKCSE